MISGSGRSPEEGNGYPLQYSCLESSMDRGAWRESDMTERLTHLVLVSFPATMRPATSQLEGACLSQSGDHVEQSHKQPQNGV